MSRHPGGSGCQALFLIRWVAATLGTPASLSGSHSRHGQRREAARSAHLVSAAGVGSATALLSPGIVSSGALYHYLIRMSLTPTFRTPWHRPILQMRTLRLGRFIDRPRKTTADTDSRAFGLCHLKPAAESVRYSGWEAESPVLSSQSTRCCSLTPGNCLGPTPVLKGAWPDTTLRSLPWHPLPPPLRSQQPAGGRWGS